MSQSEPLLTEHRDGRVLELRLNRPDKRNALSAGLRTGIVDALGAAASDEAVAVVVVSGEGEHFCAGFDLDELAAADDHAAVFADAERYHHVVHTFPKPLIAAVDGSAVAGGFDLALMCDLRIASTTARFGQPQVRFGVPAAYDLVASVVGNAVARDLCLTGRIIDAAEALDVRLVQRIVEPEDLADAARELADSVAASAAAGSMKQRFVAAQPTLFDGG